MDRDVEGVGNLIVAACKESGQLGIVVIVIRCVGLKAKEGWGKQTRLVNNRTITWKKQY